MIQYCGKEILRRSSMKRHLTVKHNIFGDWEKYVAYVIPYTSDITVPLVGNIKIINDKSQWDWNC